MDARCANDIITYNKMITELSRRHFELVYNIFIHNKFELF